MPAPAPEPALGFLHGGSFSQLATLADPAVRLWRPREIYLPDATEADFAGLTTLIVSDRLHLGLLPRVTAWVTASPNAAARRSPRGERRRLLGAGRRRPDPRRGQLLVVAVPDGDNGVRRAEEGDEA